MDDKKTKTPPFKAFLIGGSFIILFTIVIFTVKAQKNN
jgi:hypothetical protein